MGRKSSMRSRTTRSGRVRYPRTPRVAAVARLLVHLALIEERRLHLVRGYSSLYDLCVRCLVMSEGQAHRSVSGAHAAKSFPLALEMIADGRLHLTGLSLIAKRLTAENHAQLLQEVAGKTKGDILIVLARWFPKPDVPRRARSFSTTTSTRAARVAAAKRATVACCAPHITISTHDKPTGAKSSTRRSAAPDQGRSRVARLRLRRTSSTSSARRSSPWASRKPSVARWSRRSAQRRNACPWTS